MIFVEFPAIFDYFHVYFATWSKYFATWDFFRASGALPIMCWRFTLCNDRVWDGD